MARSNKRATNSPRAANRRKTSRSKDTRRRSDARGREVRGARADPDALLREPEAAELLGFKPRALQAWRRSGDGPRFVRVSSRAIRYRRRDLVDWAEERLCRSTSDTSRAERWF